MLTRPLAPAPSTDRSQVLGELARKMRATSLPRSTWRVHHDLDRDRSAEDLIRQLDPLVGRQASVVFDLGTFESLDDPAAVVAFCGRHLPRVVLSFDEDAACAHPLTGEDFELRLLLAGASFRSLERLDTQSKFRAYELTFTQVPTGGISV